MESSTVVMLCILAILLLIFLWRSYNKRPNASSNARQLEGVKTDLEQYKGTWYEQERLNSFFEPSTLENVTATYSIKPSSPPSVEVLNRGMDSKSGRESVIRGSAKVTDQLGRLAVSFFPLAPPAPYVVLSHDCGPQEPSSDYKCAVVGSDDKSFLWFLSRDKNGWTESRSKHARDIAQRAGYSPETLAKLQRVKQQ